MATTFNPKKANKIWMVTMIKQAMRRWKTMSFKFSKALPSNSLLDSGFPANPSGSTKVPSGFLAVYIGPERVRFLIPTRFLNFPIFTALLHEAEEEYGFKFSGGIVLPCEVELFKKILKFLGKDEKKCGSLEVDKFLKMISEVGFDSISCKGSNISYSQMFLPLMHVQS